MSSEEFENYIALIGKLLQLSPEQRDQISGELQDHLQMRVADLIDEGVAKPDAIGQALEEFGDAAAMAQNFQTVLILNRRRWMMRFATFSIAGAFLAAVLTMAMWPDNARFGSPNTSMAQVEAGSQPGQAAGDPVEEAPNATQRTLHAEKTLKKVVDLNYTETPFKDVEGMLESITGLNFLLTSSAQDDSLGDDEPMTFHLTGMPLNKALFLMLETRNATYVIDEGVVVIISLDDLDNEKYFRVKVFDCRKLVEFFPRTQPSTEDRTLLDLVQSMVRPGSWQDTGQGLGQVQVVNGLLVVAQTEAILQEIENFLSDLESNSQTRI